MGGMRVVFRANQINCAILLSGSHTSQKLALGMLKQSSVFHLLLQRSLPSIVVSSTCWWQVATLWTKAPKDATQLVCLGSKRPVNL